MNRIIKNSAELIEILKANGIGTYRFKMNSEEWKKIFDEEIVDNYFEENDLIYIAQYKNGIAVIVVTKPFLFTRRY